MRHSLSRPLCLVGAAATLAAACRPAPDPGDRPEVPTRDADTRLPTGARLDPAGRTTLVGQMPLAMVPAPEGDRVVLLMSGWREQGVQVVSRATGRVLQTLPQAAAFVGLAFSPDGRTLYTSGANQDVVYRYAWAGGRATLQDSLVIAPKAPKASGKRHPAGLALAPDGRTLYVAENLADTLAVVDVASGRVTARHPVGRYPYEVAVTPEGRVFVSNWGSSTLSVFDAADAGRRLTPASTVPAGRHPSAMRLSRAGRLFVASGSTDRVRVLDARTLRTLAELADPPAVSGAARTPAEGSTPNALALSADGRTLYVAEADNNAVAVFALAAAVSGAPGAPGAAAGESRLVGRVPVAWYPTALLAFGDTLLVATGKGLGTAPNPNYPHPGTGTHMSTPTAYTLGQLTGGLTAVAVPNDTGALAALTARVARANGWMGECGLRTADCGPTAPGQPRPAGAGPSGGESAVRTPQSFYPPLRHVVYVIKENRTYDQVLGDLPQGDGDTSLVFFPRAVSPNHHALAERFGVYDRFFVNAEVSADGHNWSTAAYVTDYTGKTVPSNYSGRGRPYDYEGKNRGAVPDADAEEGDVAEPAQGYLWDLARRAGISFRNYGEFVVPEGAERDELPAAYRGAKPFLEANTNPRFPGYDLDIPDQRRADVYLEELAEYARRGEMPRLTVLRLPNDHTAGARAGAPTPRAMMADNDLALGRIVEALSRSPFWRSTVVFVLEDDAQNGPDHVDSHRSPFLVISPYSRGGVHHRFANTTDALATMEEILGLDRLSQFDWYGRPLREVFTAEPDLRPYAALTPSVPLTEKNPAAGRGARASAALDLDIEDAADEDAFNRVLWEAIKGEGVPYPGVRRMSVMEAKRGW